MKDLKGSGPRQKLPKVNWRRNQEKQKEAAVYQCPPKQFLIELLKALKPKSGKPKGTTLDLTSAPNTSGIEQSAVSTDEHAEKLADSAKPSKTKQNP
ncbi:hypothetical protein JTB14_004282 [Gonioctena quinquepunctata]|nr:hypothetical protein JTB14_004282 [Gonioctena quinquepunctata]